MRRVAASTVMALEPNLRKLTFADRISYAAGVVMALSLTVETLLSAAQAEATHQALAALDWAIQELERALGWFDQTREPWGLVYQGRAHEGRIFEGVPGPVMQLLLQDVQGKARGVKNGAAHWILEYAEKVKAERHRSSKDN